MKPVLWKIFDIIIRGTVSNDNRVGKCHNWNTKAEGKENDKCHADAKDDKEHIEGKEHNCYPAFHEKINNE